MASIEKLISQLPPDTQDVFRFIWNSLPDTEKSSFTLLVGSMPSNATLMRLLVKLSTTQLKMAFGQKKKVAIVGPANVGKSTLYNQLVQNQHDAAAVSPLPGTTRVNQTADAGLFAIVDTPGADAVGEVGEQEKRYALEAASEADFLIVVYDAIQGIKQTELNLHEQLRQLNKPHLVVLNKIDLVKREKTQVIHAAAKNLGLQDDQIIPVIAKDGQNLDRVLTGIAMLEPEIVAALGRGLPQYRRRLAWRTVISAASGSAIVALAPLPIIDFIPLVTIQTVMVLGVARIFNYHITPVRAREIIAAFGLAFLGRALFYQLSKLGGVPGWLLGSAIATSMTVAMGYAAIVWFESGEQVSRDQISAIMKRLTNQLVETLKSIGSKKPKSGTLSQRISEILEKTDLDQIAASQAEPSTHSKSETDR